jgi:putative addiction module killer protein
MGQDAKQKTVIFFTDANAKEPFTRWLKGLGDPTTRRRILKRIYRLEHGHYGDCKSLKGGVFEPSLNFGAGYRIYFGIDGDTIIVLRNGGNKSTQPHNIETAKIYWKEYLRNA